MQKKKKKIAKKKVKRSPKAKKKAARSSSKKTLNKKEPTAADIASLAYPNHLAENQVIEDLRHTVEKLKIFDSLGKTLTSMLDLTEILRMVIEKVGYLVGSRHLGLVLVENNTHEFYFQYPASTAPKRKKFMVGKGLIGKCLELGKGKLYKNPTDDEAFDLESDGLILKEPSSMVVHPIYSKGSILGALTIVTQSTNPPLSEVQYEMVETFADYLAIAVENATNYQKVQDLTITDDLTKLYNSRYLPVVLEREIARSRRYNESLAMVFLDLDNFKSVNDKYGHIAGSNLLTELGDFLFEQIRTSDIGIRYGGDEFVLVLPRTSKEEALQVVQRAIDDLRKKVFLKDRGLNIHITASFGISCFPEDGNNVDAIIAAADKAMYHVKRTTKNGVFASSIAAARG